MAIEHPNAWGCVEASPVGPLASALPSSPPIRLVDRIAADGLSYGMTATVAFSSVLV
jgi:hypothetical protein